MRVSEFYKLGRTQATLDFVNVDVVKDTKVFISPKALTLLPSEFGDECVHLVQNFFQTVMDFIRAGQNKKAEALLQVLHEPNETRLGVSKGKAQGRALGSRSAHNVWEALSESEAAKSGLLEDLEDTVLMIEGISVDIISDITTNLIRRPLIAYTKEMCLLHGIPMQEGVNSGPLWDSTKREWYVEFVSLPIPKNNPLILVPKAIVRTHLMYDSGEYFRHFLLTRMQEVELASNSELVEIIKSGKGKKQKVRRRVTKKALIGKYGHTKATVVELTKKHPDVLERYRALKRDDKHLPLTHDDIASVEQSDKPDWGKLVAEVTKTPTGTEAAAKYEKAVEGLLTALLYPNLTNPRVQHAIHETRKRIDITYTNMALNGFFKWVSSHYSSALVFVECKNYGNEIGNPELDQLSGRFSPSRGQFGLLVCRAFKNKDLFMRRCIDTARDQRGFVLPLDDNDLASMAKERKEQSLYSEWTLLHDRFAKLLT